MEQPHQKKRKWDVPGPATLPQPAHMLVAAGLSSVLGNGVVGTQAASSTPAVDIALAQAAAAALFSKYHPGAQVKLLATSSTGVAIATAETKPGDLSREVYINDAPTGVRIHLTKRGVQDEIQSRTGTLIVTRGRYYPPGAVPDGSEKPLHLLVKPALQSGTTDEQKQQAVSNAVSDIQRILQGIQPAPRAQPHAPAVAPPPAGLHPAPPYGHPPPLGHGHPHPHPQHPPGYSMPPAPYGAPPPSGYATYLPPPSGPVGAAAPPRPAAGPGAAPAAPAAPATGSAAARPAGSGSGGSGGGSGSCNVYTGIPHPGSFPVADKVRGPGGSFLQHISSTTGATLQMRGHGSGDAEGPDPLHVFVSAPGAKALEDAKSLLLDLLRTVAEEYKQANPTLAHTVQQPVITLAPSAPTTSYGAAAAPPSYQPPMYGVAAPPAGAPPYYPPPGQPYYPQAGPYPPTQAYGGPPPPYTAPPYPGAPPPYPYPATANAPGAAPQPAAPYHYPPATTAPPPYSTAPPTHPPSQPPAGSAAAPPGFVTSPAPPSVSPPTATSASATPAPRPYGTHAAPAAAPPTTAYPSTMPASTTAPAAPLLGSTSVYGTAAKGVGSTDAATAGAAPAKRKFREAREGEQYAQAMGRNQQGNTGSNIGSSAANKHASFLGNGASVSMDGSVGSVGGERAANGPAGASAPAPAPQGAAAAAQAPPASSGAQVTGSLQGLIGYYDGDD